MKNKVKWIVLGLLFLAVIVLTFTRTPEAITSMLEGVSKETSSFSAVVHLLLLAIIGLGLAVKKRRNILFSLLIAFLSLSATVVAVGYLIVPNIIVFGMFSVLIAHACLTGKLNFDLHNIAPADLSFGLLGLVFGFWYLHWVDTPVWLNALLYSPLGVVNCPTLVTVSGFLCLARKPRSSVLEAAVAMATLYFGLFGIFRLGAYVDVVLVACGVFLMVRSVSDSVHERAAEESAEQMRPDGQKGPGRGGKGEGDGRLASSPTHP